MNYHWANAVQIVNQFQLQKSNLQYSRNFNKGGVMQFKDIHIGMKCGSKKGSGTVTWIDGSTRTIYMADTENNSSFEVRFEDIIEDPQAHNKEDRYY